MLNQKLSGFLNTTTSRLRRLDELGIQTLEDFLLYFPRAYEDKSKFRKIVEMRTDEVNTVKGVLKDLQMKRTKFGKLLISGIFQDETGAIEVVWFNQPHLMRILHTSDKVILSGKLKYNYGKLSMQSPAYERIKKEQVHTGRIVPVYRETELPLERKEKLSSKWLREKIKPLLHYSQYFQDYMPLEILKRQNLVSYSQAISQIHFPESPQVLKKARERLAFDELFMIQLLALQKRFLWRKGVKNPRKVQTDEKLLNDFVESLPFKLTNAQFCVINEILADLKKDYPMLRLIQGDVGSGKTVVAAAIILQTIKAGYQAVLMAPTEILAWQHYETLQKFLKPFAVRIEFLAGSTPARIKKEFYNGLKNGEISFIIGTHALIQEKVGFKNLGLAVVDEQHRFGVKQRDILKSHGSPHLLSMTATPIPRTLAMTVYGDKDISIIDEMPPGRQKIITRVVPEYKRQDAYRWIEEQVKKGRQVFIICPLIEESEVLEVKAAKKEFKRLNTEVFSDLRLGLLHGRLKQSEKDEIMFNFVNRKLDVLVSTSVVEVGIDVPNATIIIIEGAERFGLAQLHQFRGRVGRGEHQSYCFLFPSNDSDTVKKRLNAVSKYSDGLKLAGIDLELRGPGEIYGVRQSGIPDLKMASFSDAELINRARIEAEKLIEKDPELWNYLLLDEKLKKIKGGEEK